MFRSKFYLGVFIFGLLCGKGAIAAAQDYPDPFPAPSDTFDGDIEENCSCAFCESPTPSPTETPTVIPSLTPTESPTEGPTETPTETPIGTPTEDPSTSPTPNETETPTLEPTPEPTAEPTVEATTPSTPEPTPELTPQPSPSASETETGSPAVTPTEEPSTAPTPNESETPTLEPTVEPTVEATVDPTAAPTSEETFASTPKPSPTAQETETEPSATGETSTPTSTPTPWASSLMEAASSYLFASAAGQWGGLQFTTVLWGDFDRSSPSLSERTISRANDISTYASANENQCTEGEEPEEPVAAPYAYLGNDDPFQLIGRDIPMNGSLYSICQTPPQGCPSGSVACSKGATWNDLTLYYYVRLKETCPVNAGERTYEVKGVYLRGDDSFDPPESTHQNLRLTSGQNIVWAPVAQNPNVANSIWGFLGQFANGQARMQCAYLKSGYSQWHESQHERHYRQYTAMYQQVLNSPSFPTSITLSCDDTRDPKAVVMDAVTADRDQRLAQLTEAYTKCTNDEFHGQEDKPGSYKWVTGQCACNGIDCPALNAEGGVTLQPPSFSDDTPYCLSLMSGLW